MILNLWTDWGLAAPAPSPTRQYGVHMKKNGCGVKKWGKMDVLLYGVQWDIHFVFDLI